VGEAGGCGTNVDQIKGATGGILDTRALPGPSKLPPMSVVARPCSRSLIPQKLPKDGSVFAAGLKKLPPLRALVHVTRPGSYPHLIRTPGEATDVALAVQHGMRTARREYGNIGTVHLFMAAPAGLAMLIGQLLNTFGAVQTYEHVTVDGSHRKNVFSVFNTLWLATAFRCAIRLTSSLTSRFLISFGARARSSTRPRRTFMAIV
jgi:SMODS-associated and fused to various effectors sensor domain